MANSQKEKKLPEARVLFAEGVDKAAIARALGVSARTVRRWARQDALKGRPWEVAGEGGPLPDLPAAQQVPKDAALTARLCRRLRERLADLVETSEAEEDRMLKLCRVIEHLREGGQDLMGRLETMREFASFCARNLPEEEMAPVRKAVSGFMNQLKEDHS
ncbi:MAG: helix-turn-helix domain-containing protein [Planctomycetota bacterium]